MLLKTFDASILSCQKTVRVRRLFFDLLWAQGIGIEEKEKTIFNGVYPWKKKNIRL